MNFVVVEIAGKQFLVRKNDTIETPKLTGATGETVTFSKVLLYWDGKKISLGRPYLDGFSVEGRIISSGRSPKIIVYKYKRRKDSHRKIGHRQDFCRVEIENIVMPGRGEKLPEEKKSASTPKEKPAKKAPTTPAGKKAREDTGKKPKPPTAKKTAGRAKPSPRKKPAE